MKTVQLLESIMSHTTDAIDVFDINNRILLVNPAFEKIYGWTAAELIGQPLPIIPEHLYEEAYDMYRKIQAGETISDYITVRQRKDGSLITVNLTILPVRDENGEIIAKAAITRDVTEHINILNELKEINKQHHFITSNMSDVISLVNREGKLMYASPSLEKFIGKKHIEGVDLLTYIHPEDRVRCERVFQRMIKEFCPINIDYRVIHKDGNIIHVETKGVPVDDEHDTKFVLTTRDITKRKMAENIVRNTDKMLVLGELAAGIAHEIRNPISSIRGLLQLIREESNANPEHLELMFSEIDRINMIVSELLLLAKPQKVNYKAINLKQVVEDVLRLLKSEAMLKQTHFVTNWNERDATVFGDANHLKQVIINVIKNGIEAMENGGEIVVTIDHNKCNQVVVRFKDEGCGIRKEVLNKIGEPFFTTKANGTGLGLMISKKIIQDHEGKLHIDSVAGKGATITIVLPRY